MANSEKAHEKGGEKHSLIATLIVIFCWYTANIALLLLNKFLLSSTKFRQPVFLTLCHMAACVLMGLAIGASGYIPVKPIKTKLQFGKVVLLSVIFCGTIVSALLSSWNFGFSAAAKLGSRTLLTVASVLACQVLGNASLRYLPVSFNQAIGATTPFFTAIFAFFLQGTRESFHTYLTLFPIMGGIAIASGGEPLFHLVGFIFCMMATAGRALKSVAQSMIMSDATEKLDPMSLLLYMSAVCVVILIPMTLILEPNALIVTMNLIDEKPAFTWWLLCNSMLAYFVNLTNFLVTKYTSPLTLQVLGNAKGVIAAVVSIMIFLNPVTVSGVLGYALTVIGVGMYSETKRRAGKSASHVSSSAGSINSAIIDIPGDDLQTKALLDGIPGRSTPSRGKEGTITEGKGTSLFKDMFFRSQERTEVGDNRI